MSVPFDFVIAGNNIAALVSAFSLSEKFKIVVINPSPLWGAHFGGNIIDGEHFDTGMNFFEFTSFNNKSDDVAGYNELVRNDAGRFSHVAEKFIKSFVEVREVETPEMILDGIEMKDVIISNNFDELNKLPSEIKQKIINELESITSKENPLHASLKKQNELLFLENNYQVVSIANHGETFHQLFIEPFCNKVLGINSSEMPALFHRTAWTPLIYPETLLSSLRGNKVNLPPTIFHYPKAGYFGSLAEKLLQVIEQKKNITIINEKIIGFNEKDNSGLVLGNGEIIKANKLIWTMDLPSYYKLRSNSEPGSFDKTSIALAFIQLPTSALKKKISSLNILDKKTSVYRITNQTCCSGIDSESSKIVVELNYNYHSQHFPKITEGDIKLYIIKLLKELNYISADNEITKITIKNFNNALTLPTFDNFLKFNSMNEKIKNEITGDHMLIGQSVSFAANSLNDQIIQGLKIGKTFNN